MSDDILARLKEMAAGGDPAAVKEAPKVAKAKVVEFVPTPVNDPEAFTGMPVVPAVEVVADIVQWAAQIQALGNPAVSTVKGAAKVVAKEESGVRIPVVVLDDASTFSNLAGAKIVYLDPAAEEVDDAAYAKGIRISDLLTMRDAFNLMVEATR